MSKVLALDLGDQWTGIAISDASKILAKPLKTVPTAQLVVTLQDIFDQEAIETVIVGYPKTMKGTESQQTIKVTATKQELEQKFPDYKWLLWDERLSSKRAQSISKSTSKEDKLHAHAVAAAFILDSYLQFLSMGNE